MSSTHPALRQRCTQQHAAAAGSSIGGVTNAVARNELQNQDSARKGRRYEQREQVVPPGRTRQANAIRGAGGVTRATQARRCAAAAKSARQKGAATTRKAQQAKAIKRGGSAFQERSVI